MSIDNIENNLPIFFELEELAKKMDPETVEKRDFYRYTSENYFNIGLHREAIRQLKVFFRTFENGRLESPEVIDKWGEVYRVCLSQQAESYAQLKHLDSAEMFHKKSIDFSKKIDILSHASALNNFGLFMLNHHKNVDSALRYFQDAKTTIEKSIDQYHLYGSIMDNLADVSELRGLNENAKALYYQNFIFYQNVIHPDSETIDGDRLISAGCQFVNLSLSTNVINDSLSQVLKDIEHLILSDNNPRTTLSNKLEFYKTNERLLIAQGNLDAAYEISKLVKKISDSIADINSGQKVISTSLISENLLQNIRMKYHLEKQEQLTRIQNQRLKIWIITLSSVIGLLILTLLFIRRRKLILKAKNQRLNAEKNLEITNLKNQKLQELVQSKERDLSDFAIYLSQNQEWVRNIAAKLSDLKFENRNTKNEKYKELEEEVLNKVKYDYNTQDFYDRLDKLSHSFYKKLSDRYPNLTNNDKRLCSLIRLKISNQDIASLQNISISSVITSRYRLRKKLQLQEEDNLDNFIQNL